MMGSGAELQLRQIACQELLTRDGVCSGWLRGKTTLHKLGEAMDEKINRPGFAKQFTSRISWQRRYVVVVDGYLHIYTSETSKRPAKVIDLCGFQKVERDENLNVSEVPWPFKISSEISNKVMNYGAMSEPEMKKWIEAVGRGIDEAKQSGRKPLICEKETTSNRKKKLDKPLPSIPLGSEEFDEGADSDYDYIPEIEEIEQRPNQSISTRSPLAPPPGESPSSPTGPGYSAEYELNPTNGMHSKAESKKSILPRKEMTVPSPPSEHFGAVRANLKKVPPITPAAGANPKPIVPQKNIQPGPSTHAKPAVPVKNSQSIVDKNAVPKVPVVENQHSDEEEEEVEYEMMDDTLVTEATWTGPAEEGTEIMKSMKEEGAFMIRNSTTGNGDVNKKVLFYLRTSVNLCRFTNYTNEGRMNYDHSLVLSSQKHPKEIVLKRCYTGAVTIAQDHRSCRGLILLCQYNY